MMSAYAISICSGLTYIAHNIIHIHSNHFISFHPCNVTADIGNISTTFSTRHSLAVACSFPPQELDTALPIHSHSLSLSHSQLQQPNSPNSRHHSYYSPWSRAACSSTALMPRRST